MFQIKSRQQRIRNADLEMNGARNIQYLHKANNRKNNTKEQKHSHLLHRTKITVKEENRPEESKHCVTGTVTNTDVC